MIIKGRNAGTSNIGIISGGDSTNVVTPKLTLKAEARSHDPKFRKKIVEEFRKAFEKAARHLKNVNGQTGRVRFKSDLKYEAFLMSEDAVCVRIAMAAVEAIGMQPATRISNGGLDANWMVDHGLATVTLGCGQEAIHTVNEKLNINRYLQACRIGLLLATGAT